MCEQLKAYIENDLQPFVTSAMEVYTREGDFEREAALKSLLETFEEMLSDIESGMMDMWECGELYDEFRRYRASGDFLDKIT